MRIYKILSFMTVLAVSAPAFAQYEGTTFDDRIGHGQDSIEVRQNVSMMLENYKQKNWNDAYENFKFVLEKAPFARLDTYTRGVTILENLVSANNGNKELQKKYLDELLNLYEIRLQNAQGLNSCNNIKTTRGPVLCRKAYDYATYAPYVYEDYTLDKAYDSFTEGINLVNEDPSIEIEGFVLSKYFATSYQKYQADPDGFRERFLNDYMLAKNVCEEMLAKANQTEDKAEAAKIVRQYDPVYVYVNGTFASSNAATKEQILAIYEPKVEENKGNVEYLRSALNVMGGNYCDDTDVYFNAAKYANALEPDINSCIGMGASFINDGNIAEAISYYEKAVELAQGEKNKAQTAYNIANILGRKGQTAKAEPFLAQAEQLDASYKGKCDLYRSRRDASEKKFDSAIAFANKAAEEDPSISGTATRLAEQIEDWKVSYAEYERQEAERQAQIEAWKKQQAELERQRQAELARQRAQAAAKSQAAKDAQAKANAAAKAEYDRRKAEYDRKMAEYNAQVARQKKLEDFWKGN